MELRQQSFMKWAPLMLILTGAAFRLIPHPQNFAPIGALAFCGALYLPRAYAFWVPVTAMFISDILLNLLVYKTSLFASFQIFNLLAYFIMACLGILVSRRKNAATLAGGLIGSSAIFFFVTNAGAWLTNSYYTKDLSGLITAFTTGIPTYPPPIAFYKGTIAGDLCFGVLIILACEFIGHKSTPNAPEASLQKV